jgi:photosystem II stability/assembly factor-like uncharacterized protein
MLLNLTANGDDLFLSSNVDIYHSTDGGQRWILVNPPKQLFPTVVSMGSQIFAGTYGGVFRTNDNGATWTAVNTGIEGARINLLLPDGNKLYCATNMGVFVTSDQGANWTDINSLNLIGLIINGLVKKGEMLYASSPTDGVFASSDLGDTWMQLGNDLESTEINSMAVTDTKIFVSIKEGVYSTPIDKKDWTLVNEGLPTLAKSELGFGLSNAGSAVFATTSEGVYRLDDGATSWMKLGSTQSAMIRASYNTVYAIMGQNLMRSKDNGMNWVRSDTGLCGGYIYSLVQVTDAGRTTLYSGGSTVNASTDNGETWSMVYDEPVSRLAVVGKSVLAGVGDGMVRLGQDGKTFEPAGLTGLLANTLYSDGATIYVNTANQDFTTFQSWRSTDLGATWTELVTLQGRVTAFTSIGSDLFASTLETVFRSTDMGASWTAAGDGLPSDGIYSLGTDGKDLFAGLGYLAGASYRSQDKGATWQAMTPLGAGLFYDFIGANGAIIAASDRGFFRSTDHGVTWSDEASKDLFTGTYDVEVIDDYVYAGTLGRGIWRRPLSEFAGPSAVRERSLESHVTLSPNPAKNILQFETNDAIEQVRIVNALGQTVRTFSSSDIRHNEIEIIALPAGSYIAVLKIGDSQLQRLFVKQ